MMPVTAKEVKIGDVFFVNWSNPYSKLILKRNEWLYGEKGFSHCGIITDVNDKEIFIHEAVARGFVSSWYPKDFVQNKIDEGNCQILRSKLKYKDLKNCADQYLGRGYAWFDVIHILIATAFPKLMKFTGAKSLICSEAVARILYDASEKQIILGYDPENKEQKDISVYKIPYDLIEPYHIYKYFK